MKKNLLLFMTNFYGYNKNLKAEFENQGWNVTLFSDEVNLSFFERAISKFFPVYKNQKFFKYFKHCIKETENQKFDLILIVFGANFMMPKHISILRYKFPNTKIVYYSWDSTPNFPLIEKLFKSVDVSYTFDYSDAQKYGVNFLPLFYIRKEIKKENNFDVSAIMSFFIEKADNVDAVLSLIPKNLRTYYYLKIRDKHYLNRIKRRINSFYSKYECYMNLNSIEREKCLDIFASSKVVIDCPLPKQNGLTMRTFEVLANNRKLITTNKNIINYEFYSPNNIFVVDENTREIPLEFFETPFDEHYSLSNKYSIRHFVNVLLGEENEI